MIDEPSLMEIVMAKGSLELAHIPDIAWLIALWKAIHGGDPAPSDRVAAASILSGAMAYLNGQAVAPVSVATLASQFKGLGLELHVTQAETPRHAAQTVEAFGFGGGIGSHFAQLCYGIPPHRQCVIVQLPGRFPTSET
jgi:hypothetical protein